MVENVIAPPAVSPVTVPEPPRVPDAARAVAAHELSPVGATTAEAAAAHGVGRIINTVC